MGVGHTRVDPQEAGASEAGQIPLAEENTIAEGWGAEAGAIASGVGMTATEAGVTATGAGGALVVAVATSMAGVQEGVINTVSSMKLNLSLATDQQPLYTCLLIFPFLKICHEMGKLAICAYLWCLTLPE